MQDYENLRNDNTVAAQQTTDETETSQTDTYVNNNRYNLQNEQNSHLGKREPEKLVSVISVGEWIWSYILMMTPIIGFIVTIIWVLDKSTNQSKRNMAKAILIVKAIMIGIYILLFILALIFSIQFISKPNYYTDFPVII